MEDFSIKYFGERLKKFAKDSYGSVNNLANKLEMHPSALSNYTSGNREPKASFLKKLASLGCDINWLLTGKEGLEERILKLEGEMKKQREELTELKAHNYDLGKDNRMLIDLLKLIAERFGDLLVEKDQQISAKLVALGLLHENKINR